MLQAAVLSMGHIYLSHSHPIAIYACPNQSYPMACFPWDSHMNGIPMDMPGKQAIKNKLVTKTDQFCTAQRQIDNHAVLGKKVIFFPE